MGENLAWRDYNTPRAGPQKTGMTKTGSHTIVALLIVVITILAAVVFVYPRQWSRGFLVNDEMYFATLANNIAAGRGYVTFAIEPFVADEIDSFPIPEFTRPPAYSVFLAGAMKTGLGALAAGIGLSIAWLTVTMLAFYRITMSVLGSWRTAAFLCGVYLATYTSLVHGTMTSPEAQFDALFLVTCWALLRPSRTRTFMAGLCTHLVVATKMLAIAYAPLVPVFLVWNAGRSSGEGVSLDWAHWRRMLPLLMSLVGGFLASWVVVSTVAAIPGNAQVETFSRYSLNFMQETSEFPTVGSPWYHLDPPAAADYFAERPSELITHTARLVSRTPTVLNAVGALPLQGSLGVLLLLVIVLAATVGWPQRDGTSRRFLWFSLAAFAVTLPAVWTYLVRVRYFYQLYPLFLLVIAAQAERLRGPWMGLPRRTRIAVATAAIVVLIAYPLSWTLREAYGRPNAFLGRGLAIHVLDYAELGEDIAAHAPAGVPVVTDFAYEVPWLTGTPTIFVPVNPLEFRWVIDRFDVATVALRRGAHERHVEQLTDFTIAVERSGYVIYVRS